MVKIFHDYTLENDNEKLRIIGGIDFKGSKSTPNYNEICHFLDMRKEG